MDDVPDIINGWRAEAGEHSRIEGCEFYRSYDDVLLKYLKQGDCRPFLDLVLKLKRQPGKSAGQYIAAMIYEGLRGRLPRAEFPFDISIEENQRRRRGRPPRNSRNRSSAEWKALDNGRSLVNAGLEAPMGFWVILAFSLGHREKYPVPANFPLRSSLKAAGPRMGRPSDPELPMRDGVFALSVRAEMESGASYEAAIELVREATIKFGRADFDAQGKTWDRGLFRRAYDADQKRRR